MAQQDGGDDVTINIDVLSTDLENMLFNTLSISPKRRSCIFRVPNTLSRYNPKAYEPEIFSIGPFHYNKPHLKATENIKLRYLHELLSRHPDPKAKLRDLTTSITKLRDEARQCYQGSIDVSMDEFVKLLVLDGCFLIEYLRKRHNRKLVKDDDPIFGVRYMGTLIRDLILLENQIPWFVLDCLFHKTMTPDVNLPLSALVISNFSDIFSTEVKITYREDKKCENKHILDLLRNSLIMPSTTVVKQVKCLTNSWQLMSATSLEEAGIKLKKAASSTISSILDIQFKDGVLQIPPLRVHDCTEPLFRNLVCLEQCLPHCKEVISSYMALLDYLINTTKDMEIFIKSEIFESWVDAEDATMFFNRVFNGVSFKYFYYLDVVKDVNKYSRRSWPRYRRVLLHNYFNHPWALISVFAAAVLLILTLLQTIFTIIK